MKVVDLTNEWRISGTLRTVSSYKKDVNDVTVHLPDSRHIVLETDCVEGVEVYVGREYVGRTDKYRTLTELTPFLCPHGNLRLSPSGGLRRAYLHTARSDVFVQPNEFFMTTDSVEGDYAYLQAHASICNTGARRKVLLVVCIYNKRGKKLCKKRKTVVLPTGNKVVTFPIKLHKPEVYSKDNPFVYSATLSLMDGEEELDCSTARFGIRFFDKLDFGTVGTVMSHSCGLTGELATVETEKRKLSALKSLGYSVVRYIGCPSTMTLDVADDLGMDLIVDIFDNWSWPREDGKVSDDGHVTFDSDCLKRAESAVRALRVHPSVVLYSLGDALQESYGRSGKERLDKILALVKNEGYRPVTTALKEFVPFPRELENAGVDYATITKDRRSNEGLIKLGRGVDLCKKLTADFVKDLDAVGFDGLAVYESEKPTLQLSTSPEDYCESFVALNRNHSIACDLSDIGADYKKDGVFVTGDIDWTFAPRVRGLYRTVFYGEPKSYIVTSSSTAEPMLGERHWNYKTGEKVNVSVLTSGDVVALYQNGRLIGRRLAGRYNKNIAKFTVEYMPGKLEAVSYLRGRELCKETLVTTGEPYAFKLDGDRVVKSGELAFVDVYVTDDMGKLVTHLSPDVEITVEGGELLFLGDSYGDSTYVGVTTMALGHALAVVRGTSEKMIVRASGNGLKKASLTIKIKPIR